MVSGSPGSLDLVWGQLCGDQRQSIEPTWLSDCNRDKFRFPSLIGKGERENVHVVNLNLNF